MNIYYGNFQREPFYYKNVLFRTFLIPNPNIIDAREQNPLLIFSSDKSLRRRKRKEGFMDKIKRILFYPTKEYKDISLIKYGEHHTGHLFQFKIWKHALDVKDFIMTIWIIIFAFILLYYSNVMITHASNFHETYEKIDRLESQGQTYSTSSEYRNIIETSNSEATQ